MSKRLVLGEYYGRCISRKRVHGFLLTENRFPAGKKVDLHRHAYPHLTLILKGGFTEYYGDLVLECREGTVLVVPADLTHADEIGVDGAHSLSIEISSRICKQVGAGSDFLTRAQVLRDARLLHLGASIYAEFQRAENASELLLEGLALQLLNHALEARRLTGKASDAAWLPKVVAYLEENLGARVSLKLLGELVGVSDAHLARAFRAAYGCTVGEHLRKLRTDRAVLQLTATTKSVAKIAAECGFADQAHLCKVLRRSYGYSPTEIRGIARHHSHTNNQ